MINYFTNNSYKIRNKELKHIGVSYQEFLKSEHWNKIKERAKNSSAKNDYWKKCLICYSRNRINLHHSKYKDLSKITLHNLWPLCQDCHYKVHLLTKENSKLSLKGAMKRLNRSINC